MQSEIQQFGVFLREHMNDSLERLVDRVATLEPNYTHIPRTEVRSAIHESYHTIARSFEQDDTTPLINYCQDLSLRRAMTITLHEALSSMDMFREYLLDQLEVFLHDRKPWSLATIRQLEQVICTFAQHFMSGFDVALQKAQNELQSQALQLEAQRRTIRELSTPILPVHDGVIVLPLVGFVDRQRATQVMENLLQAITAYQADIVILDITGVPVVDTSVVNYIMQTVRAVHLVGAQMVLVGISPEIAQAVVQLGLNLRDITTRANLQQGIEYAFERIDQGSRR